MKTVKVPNNLLISDDILTDVFLRDVDNVKLLMTPSL